MQRGVFVHETSYKGNSPAKFVHRARLREILMSVRKHSPKDGGSIADFGCSNGYILREMKDKILTEKRWSFYGFDKNTQLLELAREKCEKNMEFCSFDLNSGENINQKFDIVCCFETIEHVGDWENALKSLVNCSKDNGLIVITVPNENGMQGLVKFISRYLVRKNPYGEFFDSSMSAFNYLTRLLRDESISDFRVPADGYGPHLGFEWKKLYRFIVKNYVDRGVLSLVHQQGLMMNFNYLFIFRRNHYSEKTRLLEV
ncbi:MAG: class I SAM-dependent methyltransferase [bacterium]|nr:class I SAM-dependent methyltransferase [bacterium]